MRAISIAGDLMFRSKVLIINKSKDTYHKYPTFSLDLSPCFWPIFVDFQNKAASLCFNNSTNKDAK